MLTFQMLKILSHKNHRHLPVHKKSPKSNDLGLDIVMGVLAFCLSMVGNDLYS
jgi:hypothetical protein